MIRAALPTLLGLTLVACIAPNLGGLFDEELPVAVYCPQAIGASCGDEPPTVPIAETDAGGMDVEVVPRLPTDQPPPQRSAP